MGKKRETSLKSIKIQANPQPSRNAGNLLTVGNGDPTSPGSHARSRSNSAPPNSNKNVLQQGATLKDTRSSSRASALGSFTTDKSGFRGQGQTSDGFKSTQKQVDEVVDIMKTNIEKILDRDTKLQDLDSRCQTLHDTSATFQSTTKKVAKKFWWKDKIYLIVIVGIIGFILLSIVIAIFLHYK